MFQSWIVKHGKNYKTPEELLHRLKIFYDNYLYVIESNKNANGGAILGLNKFADLHVDEFLPGAKSAAESKKLTAKRSEEDPKIQKSEESQVSQQPRPSAINWEYNAQQQNFYLPPVGRQDTNNLCLSDSFAFALQTVVTAKHAITNNLTSPVIVSSQYFLDCNSIEGCTVYYTWSELYRMVVNVNLPLVNQYPGAETGVRSSCKNSSLSSTQQQFNRPYIVDRAPIHSADKYFEDEVVKGPISARILISKRLLQFYTSGVITESNCSSNDNITYNVAVTGFTRTGINGSLPFWQLRGTFGTNWGIYGLFWIQKSNDTFNEYASC